MRQAGVFPRGFSLGDGHLERGPCLLQPDLVVPRIEFHQEVALSDFTVVVDVYPEDMPGNPGAHGDDVALQVGVVRGFVASGIEEIPQTEDEGDGRDGRDDAPEHGAAAVIP
ncbi:MAG: hypothetical protein WAV26_12085 [Candidatus Deferrimicrobium sp.]